MLDLAGIIARLEREDPDRRIPDGFHQPHSYRGFYDQLAFEPAADISIGDMLTAARSALGATYQGYKGGDYRMDGDVHCWIANWGNSDGTPITASLLDQMLRQPEPAAESGPARAAILSWDHAQQPPMDRLAELVADMSGGRVHLAQPDTGSDDYAVIVGTTPLDPGHADSVYQHWYHGGQPDKVFNLGEPSPLDQLHQQVRDALSRCSDAERKARDAGRDGDALLNAARVDVYDWVLQRLDEHREALANR